MLISSLKTFKKKQENKHKTKKYFTKEKKIICAKEKRKGNCEGQELVPLTGVAGVGDEGEQGRKSSLGETWARL